MRTEKEKKKKETDEGGKEEKEKVATEMEGRGLTKGLSSLGGRDDRP